MKDDKNLEQLLQQALSPNEEPRDWLNQNIVKRAKERERMGKIDKKRIPAAALMAAAVISVGSLTAAAAWKYLTPDQVAKEAEDIGLAAAFQGEGAISINETQTYGPYKITLLGVVSGENLSKYAVSGSTGEIRSDRTYVVTAIENADGTPRPATSEDSYGQDPFFVSPLIKGQDPSIFNAVTMGGAYTEFVQDGIQYRITETDNVQAFADRTLYLAVNSGTFYDNGAYQFDGATGEITRNEGYEGVNALFLLPLDGSKADKEKADAYIRQMEEEMNGTEEPPADGENPAGTEGSEDALDPALESEATETYTHTGEAADGTDSALGGGTSHSFADTGETSGFASEIAGWDETDFEKHAELLENLTQTLQVGPDGSISYSYQTEDGMGSSNTMLAESLFKENQFGMSEVKEIITGESDGEKSTYIETFTRNQDGTITLKVYKYKANG